MLLSSCIGVLGIPRLVYYRHTFKEISGVLYSGHTPMLESSRDILNISLAASVIVLTILVVWILVYIIKMFRDAQRALHQMTKVIEKLSNVLDVIRDKVHSAAAVIPLIVKGVEKVTDIIQRTKERNSSRRDSSKKTTKTETKRPSGS